MLKALTCGLENEEVNMPSTKTQYATEPVDLVELVDENEKRIIQYIIHLAPPLSIDSIVTLTGASPVAVLNLLEKLRSKKLIHEKKGYKRGIYFPDRKMLDLFSRNQDLHNETKKILRRIIDFYKEVLDDSEERTLILARLFKKQGIDEEGLIYIKNAADIFDSSGEPEKAIAYYDLILGYFNTTRLTTENAAIFIDTALKKSLIMVGVSPIHEQIPLLIKAEQVVKKYKRYDFLPRIQFQLIIMCLMDGQFRKASRYSNNFKKYADRIDNPFMHKMAAISMGLQLCQKGKFSSEAIFNYEKAIGNLEEFGNDGQTLWLEVMVALHYALAGRISRGMGMIDAIRNKARLLNIQRIIIFADVIKVCCLLEIGKTSEAEAALNKLSFQPADAGNMMVNHHILWEACNCKAYLLFEKKEYEAAYEYHKRALEHLSQIRWTVKKYSWRLEYLEALEAKGFVNRGTYQSEVDALLKGHDLHQKGLGYRLRALGKMRVRPNHGSILTDLEKSEQCLVTAGAEIELARTRISMGHYYLKKRDQKTAQRYLSRAWQFISSVDKNLFPSDLISILPKELKGDFMINKIVEITKSLGTLRNAPSFLESVINIAMDFTMATQGAFIAIDSEGPRIVASRNIDPSLFGTEASVRILQIILDAAKEGTEVVVPRSGKINNDFANTLRKAGINSLIGIPAEMGGHIHGYLCLSNRLDDRHFQEDTLPFMRVLSSQIAVGLSNIEIYREMKELKSRFEEEAIFYKQEMGINAKSIETIIGQSDRIHWVMKQIQQVAPLDTSVLILGETGVGKELVAKAIHNLSNRKDGPFIPVNLAALPRELVAAELFGHEKGAFTGADVRRKGRFELANGGTIFLDEIADMPFESQVKLLRVLQEGEFERLGSVDPIRSNFRVIAATNKNLQAEVEKGGFRQDLYFRLNVFPIYVPPLRERKSDIRLLAQHFVKKYSRKLGKRVKRIPHEEIKKLIDYSWPGNVRELEHTIERALILSEESKIRFSGFEKMTAQQLSAENLEMMSLADMESEFITRVLESTGWKVGGTNGAAAILGLKRQTLFSKMKKLGIRRPSSAAISGFRK